MQCVCVFLSPNHYCKAFTKLLYISDKTSIAAVTRFGTYSFSKKQLLDIPIWQIDLHEGDPQEHAGVAPELRPEGPQGVGLDLLDELDLVHEKGDPDSQADVVNSFPLLIQNQSNISGFRFFLFPKA